MMFGRLHVHSFPIRCSFFGRDFGGALWARVLYLLPYEAVFLSLGWDAFVAPQLSKVVRW